jgi:hypothetical protein
MSGEFDTRLFDLAAAVEDALAVDATINLAALAERFDLTDGEVERVVAALRAVQQALGEDLGACAPLAPPELPDDYELGAELGRGGMGVVYRAHQKSLERDVAVKVLRPGDLVFASAIARFEREARNLARLRHRHIVTVHEVGRANGHVYFTMDLVEGKSLQRRVADREMTISRAVKLVRQVCSAMVYAHQKGVVHRDLKPANVLVDDNDDAFVCDFGLARDLGEVGDATLSGQLVGTPAYMSPEQALGDRGKIGEAADIYALGAILYECLAGQAPFHGLPLARLMHAVVTDEPTPLRRLNALVPQDLAVICEKAMQKRIEDRYTTVQALAEDLERFAIGKEILARPRPLAVRALRLAARNRGALIAGSLPVVAAIAAMWWLVVPGLMHTYRMELGDRFYAEGNADGARIAYAGAGLRLPESGSAPDARCTRYANILIDEAGRLLVSGEGDRAAQLVAEARTLLPDWNHLRVFHGTPDENQMALRNDAYYAAMKARAVVDDAGYLEFSSDVHIDRLRRDLVGPRPEAATLLAARICGGPDNVFGRLEDARAPWVSSLLRLRESLPPAQQSRVDSLCLRHSRMELSYRDPALERALVSLVCDRGLGVESRKGAAAMLHRFGSFPFLRESVRHETANGFDHRLVVRDEDLDDLVARCDSLRGLDRSAAFDRCIGFVVETLSRTAPPNPYQNPALRDWDQWQWLQQYAGSRPRQGEEVTQWWERHRAEDPRARLLAALGWDLSPSALSPELLLQRFHQGEFHTNANTLPWIHNLLVLTVDASVPVPFLGFTFPELVARWERALHAVPDDRYTLRVATLGFFDGAPQPHLLWQKELPIRVDETVRWSEYATPDLGILDYRIGFDRLPTLPATLAMYGQATLRWTQDGVRGAIPQADAVVISHEAATRGQYGGDNDLLPGCVTFTDGSFYVGVGGQCQVDTITLAYLKQAPPTNRSWTVADWQQALGATLDVLAKGGDVAMQNARPLVGAADFLPMTAYAKSLATVDAAGRGGNLGSHPYYEEEGRRARLLAGDLAALKLPVSRVFGEAAGQAADPSRNAFLLRLALTTEVPALREHAFDQLRAADLSPALARTLDGAIAAGIQVPEWLAARVRGTPSRFDAFVRDSFGKLTGLLLLLLTAVLASIGAVRWRGNSGGWTAAAFLFFSGLVLMSCSLRLRGIEVLTPWPGALISIVAIWLACWRYARGTFSWLLPLWWTATALWIVLVNPVRNDIGSALAVTLVLYVGLRWQRGRQDRARSPERLRGGRLSQI